MDEQWQKKVRCPRFHATSPHDHMQCVRQKGHRHDCIIRHPNGDYFMVSQRGYDDHPPIRLVNEPEAATLP